MSEQDTGEWDGLEVTVDRRLTPIPRKVDELLAEGLERHGTADDRLRVVCRDEEQADQLAGLLKAAGVQSDPRVSVRIIRPEGEAWVVVFAAKPFKARPRK